MTRAILICVLACLVAAAAAQARPSPPQARLSVAVEPKLKAWADFDVTLTLTSAADDAAPDPEGVEIFLLAEDGNEVAQGLFILAGAPQVAGPKDRRATMAMKMRWDPYVVQHVATGKKYQWVVSCKTKYGRVAGSTWFTLRPE